MHVVTVERKLPLTGRNLQQSQGQCEQPSAMADSGQIMTCCWWATFRFLRETPEGTIEFGPAVSQSLKRKLTLPTRWYFPCFSFAPISSGTPTIQALQLVGFTTGIIMAHYRASDSKREHFRRYLEKTGVVDSLTSVFVSLYEQQEKPANALEFVKQHLGAVGLASADTENLLQEVSDLRQRCAHLEEENKDLKERLHQYEAASEDGGAAN
ncbi:hypothetical protein ATANTOWER_021229 [Ataeniobius toweri]|uniref:c-Myc-binding protein n=1 Tax=Ataeniobius toweri TaxID=208326 RepID=A0ABU7A2J2_9TELE|nr:hypothetical protein [Ataeniobius toweri]